MVHIWCKWKAERVEERGRMNTVIPSIMSKSLNLDVCLRNARSILHFYPEKAKKRSKNEKRVPRHNCKSFAVAAVFCINFPHQRMLSIEILSIKWSMQ